jgi:hypothetical protein
VITPLVSDPSPNDLPLAEQNASDETPQKAEQAPDSVDGLVVRLHAIRERLFWLQAVFANTLSPDVAMEADRYRELFRDLAEELRKQDAEALERITTGHENLLFAEPMPKKPTISLALQERFELIEEVRAQRPRPPEKKPDGYVADGLQRFV